MPIPFERSEIDICVFLLTLNQRWEPTLVGPQKFQLSPYIVVFFMRLLELSDRGSKFTGQFKNNRCHSRATGLET